MNHEAHSEQGEGGRVDDERTDGPVGGARAAPAVALLVAGLGLGVTGDALLHAPGPVGLNMFLWVVAIALAA
jgi:hypothetical protein